MSNAVIKFTDEVKLSKLDETNPIEDHSEYNATQDKMKTNLVGKQRVKLDTNRKRVKPKSLVEQKQFECSDCNDVFTSSKT